MTYIFLFPYLTYFHFLIWHDFVSLFDAISFPYLTCFPHSKDEIFQMKSQFKYEKTHTTSFLQTVFMSFSKFNSEWLLPKNFDSLLPSEKFTYLLPSYLLEKLCCFRIDFFDYVIFNERPRNSAGFSLRMNRGLIVSRAFLFLNVFLNDLCRGSIAHRNHAVTSRPKPLSP